MSGPLKVMVVDDSALYRMAITKVLEADPDIEVVSTAPNGKIALMKMAEKIPDVITLDMEMPEMDGLATLKELAGKYPDIKSIVFSQHSKRGAKLTFQALDLGAVDFVTKPASSASLDSNITDIRKMLLPKVREFSSVTIDSRRPSVTPGTYRGKLLVKVAPRDVIAIGISTGGPNSLTALFKQLPKSMKQAILIVQHMPAIFTEQLARQLSKVGTIPATEAVDGEPVKAGHAYIAPGDFHMEVKVVGGAKIIRTYQGPEENYCRPAVDVLFRSVAKIYQQRAVCVIMTGMGKDGFEGAKLMKAAGAPIVAQDKASSVVWGMPRFVVESNLSDSVSSLDRMYDSVAQFIL